MKNIVVQSIVMLYLVVHSSCRKNEKNHLLFSFHEAQLIKNVLICILMSCCNFGIHNIEYIHVCGYELWISKPCRHIDLHQIYFHLDLFLNDVAIMPSLYFSIFLLEIRGKYQNRFQEFDYFFPFLITHFILHAHVIQEKFPETGKIKTGYYIAMSFKNKSELENAQFDMTNYAKVDQRNMEASKCPTETSEFYI